MGLDISLGYLAYLCLHCTSVQSTLFEIIGGLVVCGLCWLGMRFHSKIEHYGWFEGLNPAQATQYT